MNDSTPKFRKNDVDFLSILSKAIDSDFKLKTEFFKQSDTIYKIGTVAHILARAFENGQKVLICGNGGSLCDAMHFAEEFTGRFRKDRTPLPAIAISDPAHLSCVANDYGYDQVFARSVLALGRKGDVLVVISTSGNSKNIIEAVHAGNAQQMTTLGLLGRNGGEVISHCDLAIIPPGETADRIQECHIILIHLIIETVERLLFSENYECNR